RRLSYAVIGPPAEYTGLSPVASDCWGARPLVRPVVGNSGTWLRQTRRATRGIDRGGVRDANCPLGTGLHSGRGQAAAAGPSTWPDHPFRVVGASGGDARRRAPGPPDGAGRVR